MMQSIVTVFLGDFEGECRKLSLMSSSVSSLRTVCVWLHFWFITLPASWNFLIRWLTIVLFGAVLFGNIFESLFIWHKWFSRKIMLYIESSLLKSKKHLARSKQHTELNLTLWTNDGLYLFWLSRSLATPQLKFWIIEYLSGDQFCLIHGAYEDCEVWVEC